MLGLRSTGCRAQAERVLVPDAMVNLCPIPDALGDEQVRTKIAMSAVGAKMAEYRIVTSLRPAGKQRV